MYKVNCKTSSRNTGENLYGPMSGKKFLDTKNAVYKNMIHERKNSNLNFIKIKNSCFIKDSIKRIQKSNHGLEENICKSYF